MDLSWLRDKKNRIIEFLVEHIVLKNIVVNAIFLLFFVFIGLTYETNDDFGIDIIAAGLKGNPSSYLVYANIILGKILSFLYTYLPWIKWYALFTIVAIYISFVTISCIIDIRTRSVAPLIKYPFILIIGRECYFKINFTRTASILAIAAVLLLLHLIISRNREWKFYILSMMLMVISSMLRFNAYIMVLPFMGIGVFFWILCRYHEYSKTEIVYIGIVLASFFLITMALKGIDAYVYTLNPAWNEYKETLSVRTEAIDYEIPDYYGNEEVYGGIGINGNDYYMFREWMSGDMDFFSNDRMMLIADIRKNSTEVGVISIKDTIINVLPDIFREESFRFLIYIIFVYLFFGDRKKLDLLMLLCTLIVGFSYMVFFNYLGRIAERANLGIWVISALLLIFIIEERDIVISRRGTILVMLLLLLISTQDFLEKKENLKYENKVKLDAAERAVLTSEDKDNLYVVDTFSDLLYKAYGGVFDKYPSGVVFDNFISMTGWDVGSPTWYYTLLERGYTNFYKDCVNSNIIFISSDSRMDHVTEFINNHYYNGVHWEKICEFADGMGYYIVVNDEIHNRIDVNCYLEGEVNNNLFHYVREVYDDNRYSYEGTVYCEGKSSFNQKVYLLIEDKNSDDYYMIESCQKESASRESDKTGKYGNFSVEISKEAITFQDFDRTIVVLIDDILYRIPVDEM